MTATDTLSRFPRFIRREEFYRLGQRFTLKFEAPTGETVYFDHYDTVQWQGEHIYVIRASLFVEPALRGKAVNATAAALHFARIPVTSFNDVRRVALAELWRRLLIGLDGLLEIPTDAARLLRDESDKLERVRFGADPWNMHDAYVTDSGGRPAILDPETGNAR